MNRLLTVLVAVVLLGLVAILLIFDVFDVFGGDEFAQPVTQSIPAGDGGWNSERTTSPTVMWDQDQSVYKMWFVGNGVVEKSGVGMATSSDGIIWDSPQDAQLEHILANAAAENLPWDAGGFKSAVVIEDGVNYRLWYSASSFEENGRQQIGYASGNDGMKWTKHSSNPVLMPGAANEWDGHSVGQPVVIRDGGQFKMWYTGWAAAEDGTATSPSIGHATSVDGIHWSKYEGNPVVTGGSEWSVNGVGSPDIVVVRAGKLYELWVSGLDKDDHATIGRLYSDDGVRWVEDELNPLVRDDGYNFYEPHVLRQNQQYYIWAERVEDSRSGEFNSIWFTAYPIGVGTGDATLPQYVPTTAN